MVMVMVEKNKRRERTRAYVSMHIPYAFYIHDDMTN